MLKNVQLEQSTVKAKRYACKCGARLYHYYRRDTSYFATSAAALNAWLLWQTTPQHDIVSAGHEVIVAGTCQDKQE
jgi:hypothetical protein